YARKNRMAISKVSSLHIVQRLKDGTIVQIPITGQPAPIVAKPGAQYALIDPATGKSPQGLLIKRKGGSLLIEQEDSGEVLAEISGFYDQPDVSFIPEAELNGSALDGSAVSASSPVLDTAANGDQIVWREDGTETLFTPFNLGLGALGAGGLGLAAGGGGGGGGGGVIAAVSNTVAGVIVAGPVVAGNDLKVEIYQADGVTKLGDAVVNADGSFSLAVGSYMGVVIARLRNEGGNPDYLDEATQANKDLNAQLYGVEVVRTPNSTITININTLTTLAYHKAAEAAAGAPLSAEQVDNVNQIIADLFNLPSLNGAVVAPINGGSYNSANGLDAGEAYGAMLAALSGSDALNGGDSQQTIDNLLAGLTISNGTATLSEAAQALILQGGIYTSATTGEYISGDVPSGNVTYAPVFSSGNSASPADENSGPGRVVYNVTASDASGSIVYSLTGTDAALFSIDPSSGAVTLTDNPNFESKASYSFTVVATDAANNVSTRDVTLAVNNLDEVAPTITSAAVATAIDENSGTGQLVYTATSTDSAAIATGSTTYSPTCADAALFRSEEHTSEL